MAKTTNEIIEIITEEAKISVDGLMALLCSMKLNVNDVIDFVTGEEMKDEKEYEVNTKLRSVLNPIVMIHIIDKVTE